MDNLYAIHGGESIFSIVKAESEEDALDVFANNQTEDEIINEYVSDFAINDGLLEMFYKDNEGAFFNSHTGDLPERIKRLDKDQQKNHIDYWIEKNVNDFWSDKPQFATEYLKELYISSHSNEPYTGNFSHAFWVNTIKKIIQRDNWYEDFAIVKIDLTNQDYQLIYK